jgi:ATP-binding cassette subfamily B (MDR/TAP) protein 1
MADSRPSTADEKGTVVDHSTTKHSRGFFSRKSEKSPKDTEKNNDDSAESTPETEVEEVTPVGLFELFR